MNVLEKIANNPWLVIIGFILTVGSVIYAVYTNQKNKKFKEFSCYRTQYTVVENGKNNISKMSIVYDGEKVENVTISKFAIWNSGKETINGDDLVSNKKIQIKAENDAKILNIRIIGQSDSDNKFSVELDNETMATITLDYADAKDGCVIQLVHTGKASDISIDCKIKGGKKLKYVGKLEKNSKNKTEKKKRTEKQKRLNERKTVRTAGVVYCIVLYGAAICSTLEAFSVKYKNWIYIKRFGMSFLEIEGLEKDEQIKILASNSRFANPKSDRYAALTFIVIAVIFTLLFVSLIKEISLLNIPIKLRPYIEESSKYYNENED